MAIIDTYQSSKDTSPGFLATTVALLGAVVLFALVILANKATAYGMATVLDAAPRPALLQKMAQSALVGNGPLTANECLTAQDITGTMPAECKH